MINQINTIEGEWLVKIDHKEKMQLPKYEAILYIGNMQIKNTKHFTWLHKIFWRIFFGIKILDIKE